MVFETASASRNNSHSEQRLYLKLLFKSEWKGQCSDEGDELKREIIEKNEQGERVADLARQYGRSTSTIYTVLKQKESIKGITPAKSITIISKLRSSLHEKIEKLLMVWVTEKQLKGDTLTQGIICEKARAIYGDLLNQTQRTSTGEASEDSFKASRGWFDNFRKGTGIHSVGMVRQQVRM
ncbi:hypothetical protein AVEN_36020-1 [Araneus ventricosus]|uniref:HTH CENPB-type domain-containing protein n=1 Tax=Araneus ventricosus TaxID=182803 RepID=A0A4Y2KHC4_ARAVE|nr:hypothetical protein AVEN_36020-1 [Araneus ventricosus]